MSARYLETNLKRLLTDEHAAERLRDAYRDDFPEIRIAKGGLPIPVVDRKCLHSPYDPVTEAARWVESLAMKPDENVYYVVGGLGFGYHLTELLKLIPAERITVIEKDLSLLASALANCPPEIFPAGFRLILGKTPTQAFNLIKARLTENEPGIKYIEHPASSRAFPEYYGILSGIFRVQESSRRGGYKILLVSPLYGGSLPVAKYVQRAFIALGHRCEILDNSVFYPGMEHLEGLTSNRQHQGQLRGLLTALLAESITARAVEMRADLVLGLAQAPFSVEVLKELKNVGIRTAFWFIEDGQLFRYWEQFAPHFDRYFVIQKGEFASKLKSVGCQNPYYLPLGADPQIHYPLDLTPEEQEFFGSELSHVGAGYHNRRQFFAGLLDLNFKLWGSDWENPGALGQVLQRNGQRVSTEESVKIFNASRININLHSSTYHEGIDPFGDYLNPRIYEIASCGAFQLVDPREYLFESFEKETEVVTFSSLKDLREKAEYYLSKPLERLEIAATARDRVLAEHTYSHRMLELLGAIAGENPDWAPRSGGLPTAEEIMAQSGAESELGRLMSRFVGRGALTLEDVACEIEKSEGEMNRTEAMILLLNEFRRWGQEKGVL